MSARWVGRCPACGEWDTLKEAPAPPGRRSSRSGGAPATPLAPRPLAEVEPLSEARIPTGITELDRVLGGGLVPGSLVLIGGEPGIGKSTFSI